MTKPPGAANLSRPTPEVGVPQSFNTYENNAPYLMYANREGFTELYAQNHPAYCFFAGSGGNIYDAGLPKGLYKLSIRYWGQKGQGSIYPSTRQPAGNVLAYQEYRFRIQSQNGIGTGGARIATDADPSHRQTHQGRESRIKKIKQNTETGSFYEGSCSFFMLFRDKIVKASVQHSQKIT